VVATFAATLPPPQEATYNVDISYVPAGQGGAGQPQSVTYPSGKILTYQYDATGQITRLNWNGQPLISNIAWTPLGAPKGWNWSFVQGNPASTRTYDTAGQLTSNGIASYQYDAAGRVSRIAQNLYGPATTSGGPATPFTLATTVGYDAAGRVSSVTHTPQLTPSLPAGIKLQDIVGPLTASYQYDANGNRSQASYGNYGGSGNLNSLSRSFGLNNAHNRVLAVNDTLSQTTGGSSTETRTLQWDAAGYLQNDGALIFEYDPRGQISKITNTTSGSIATYQSNALGQRVRKVVDGQVTDTVYGEELGMASYPLGNYQPGSAANTTEYLYLPTDQGPMPVAVQIGNALYAIDADHLNTPRRLTDQNGNPVWQWVTTGFGELEPTAAETGFVRARLNTGTPPIAGTAAVAFNLRYPGQQYDAETGLYYNHHRYYDPYLTVGYTQADPIGLEGGWNRYGYVFGDSVNWIDPDGLDGGGVGITLVYDGRIVVKSYAGQANANGTEHALGGEGGMYHVHIRDSAGNEVRIRTDNWEPLTPEDADILKKSRPIKNFCKSLTPGEKYYLHGANQNFFHRARLSDQQMMKLSHIIQNRAKFTTRGGRIISGRALGVGAAGGDQ